MTTNKRRDGLPTRSQRKRPTPQEPSNGSPYDGPFDEMAAKHVIGEKVAELTADTSRLLRALNSIIDRVTPMHLRACSRPMCVGVTVGVIHDERYNRLERLCATHMNAAIDGIRQVEYFERKTRRDAAFRASFDELDPAMQYGLEGR